MCGSVQTVIFIVELIKYKIMSYYVVPVAARNYHPITNSIRSVCVSFQWSVFEGKRLSKREVVSEETYVYLR